MLIHQGIAIMPQENPDGRLHLPDLSIDNFRSIDKLSISRLGRVTLLAGRNGIGKTTVLDAIRVYAARGHPAVLTGLLKKREELTVAFDEDGDEVFSPEISALFHGRKAPNDAALSIGSSGGMDRLEIRTSILEKLSMDVRKTIFMGASMNSKSIVMKITFRDKERYFPWKVLIEDSNFHPTQLRRIQHELFDDEDKDWSSEIECESLGPGLPGNATMVRFWDRIALTDSESLPIQALQLILRSAVNGVAVIGDDGPRVGKTGRRIIVRLPGTPIPVPLKSLGDGAIRLFGVALALANSRNGFLVIDEAENGVHYSIQRDFWRMILQTAHQDNIQVIATTHSWDCVRGFARAATEFEDAEGMLVRLERDDDGMRAIEYSEEELRVAAEQGIEVR